MEQSLECIVKEVIKRIKALQKQKKILLILRDGSDFSTLKIIMQEMIKRDYEFELLSLLQNNQEEYKDTLYKNMTKLRSAMFKVPNYKELMEEYEGMIISDISLRELKNINNLYFEGNLGQLIFETLKKNKPIYCLSEDIQDIKNPGLIKKINILTKELKELGIRIVQSNGETKSSNDEIAKYLQSNRKSRAILQQKFITLRDIKAEEDSINNNQNKEIYIAKDSKLTMEVQDYIYQKGMTIRRV